MSWRTVLHRIKNEMLVFRYSKVVRFEVNAPAGQKEFYIDIPCVPISEPTIV